MGEQLNRQVGCTYIPGRRISHDTQYRYNGRQSPELDRAGRGSADTVFTRMGFRQLLIFNKELSQAEVNDVLRVMFPA